MLPNTGDTERLDAADVSTLWFIDLLENDRIYIPLIRVLILAFLIVLMGVAWRLGAGAMMLAGLTIALAFERVRGAS